MTAHLKVKALKRRKADPKQFPIATFDIEAKEWVNHLVTGFYDGKEFQHFPTIEKFLQAVLRRKYAGFRVYAHYGGKFDFLFLLEKLGYKAVITEINGHILEIKVRIPGQRKYVYFRDSYRMLPAALAKLTETFNVRHKKGSIDFEKMKYDKKTLEYLESDCRGLYEVLRKFEALINGLGGELKLTLASTALDVYLRKFLPETDFIPTYPKINEKVRTGYYGGRVEVYRKEFRSNGKQILRYFDYNSLYPYVMRDNYFPVGNPVHRQHDFNLSAAGFARITADVPQMDKPPLPIHTGGMMLFPYGQINGWYAYPYLEKLDRLKIPYFVHEAYEFGKARLFTDWVDSLYALRQAHRGDALEFIAKILLNSLYGKFAQKTERTKMVQYPSATEMRRWQEQGIPHKCYSEKYDLWQVRSDQDLAYILPGISAYVTTYAQLTLYEALENFDVWYCDTDSIFTTADIVPSTDLGKLKIEAEISEAIFLSQKLYAYKTLDGDVKIKAKGFPVEQLNWADFEKGLRGDYSGFIFDSEKGGKVKMQVLGFKESIRRYRQFLTYGERKKSVKNVDTKRIFSGLESEPMKI